MHETVKICKNIHPGLGYDYKFGVFWRLKESPTGLVPSHLLFPNAEGLLQYFCVADKKNKKHVPLRAAYEIFNETRLTVQQVVYPKDLDDGNWKADNLGMITREEYAKLRDALYNITNDVSVHPHPKHTYTYIVGWKEKGRIRTKTVHDVTKVQQIRRIIRMKSSKTLSKYVVSA